MASMIIISLWLASLFASAALGWLIGRRVWLPLGCAPGLRVDLPPQSGGLEAARSQREKEAGVICHQPLPKRARASIFDDMPALEAVRAEAKAIREEANLWETPDILAAAQKARSPVLIFDPCVGNELIKLHTASEKSGEAIDRRHKIKAA